MKYAVPLISIAMVAPALAEENRALSAHEHGVGTLNIAIDGTAVAMEFMAPGADIVGFEYVAKSAEDRAAVDAAVATLAKPLELFVLPAAAECSVVQASAGLEIEGEDAHDDHDHGDHAASGGHDDHGHDDHGHDDHASDDHGHEDHGHDDHAEAHDHDAHDHDQHTAEGATHSEFHAEYAMTCNAPDALIGIEFAYFDVFENALEVEVQVVSDAGAQAFEVERAAPTLDLRGSF